MIHLAALEDWGAPWGRDDIRRPIAFEASVATEAGGLCSPSGMFCGAKRHVI